MSSVTLGSLAVDPFLVIAASAAIALVLIDDESPAVSLGVEITCSRSPLRNAGPEFIPDSPVGTGAP